MILLDRSVYITEVLAINQEVVTRNWSGYPDQDERKRRAHAISTYFNNKISQTDVEKYFRYLETYYNVTLNGQIRKPPSPGSYVFMEIQIKNFINRIGIDSIHDLSQPKILEELIGKKKWNDFLEVEYVVNRESIYFLGK